MTRLPATAPGGAALHSGWTPYHWALAGMIVTYVWRIQQMVPVLSATRFTILTTLAAIALSFTTPHLQRLGVLIRHPVAMAVGFILLWMVLSVPGSVYAGQSFRFIYQDHIKTVLLTLLVAKGIRTARDVERLLLVHVVGAVFYCAFILTHIQVGSDGRFPGLVYYDANDLAMLLVCTLPFLVYFLRPGVSWTPRLLALATIGLFVLTLTRTGSRSGFLGMVTVFLLLLFTFRSIPRATRIGAVLGILVALTLVGSQQYWERIATLTNPQSDYNWSGNATSGRVEVWKRGMGYMARRPVFGVGASAFFVAEGKLSDLARLQQYGRGLKWSAPHNSFVQIGAELGAVGLLAFLVLLWRAMTAMNAVGRHRPGPPGEPSVSALGQAFLASLCGYCVCGFFLSQAYSIYLYSLLGLVIGLSRVSSAQGLPEGAVSDALPRYRPSVLRVISAPQQRERGTDPLPLQ